MIPEIGGRAVDAFNNVAICTGNVVVMVSICPFVICFAVVDVEFCNEPSVQKRLDISINRRSACMLKILNKLTSCPRALFLKVFDHAMAVLGMAQSLFFNVFFRWTLLFLHI